MDQLAVLLIIEKHTKKLGEKLNRFCLDYEARRAWEESNEDHRKVN